MTLICISVSINDVRHFSMFLGHSPCLFKSFGYWTLFQQACGGFPKTSNFWIAAEYLRIKLNFDTVYRSSIKFLRVCVQSPKTTLHFRYQLQAPGWILTFLQLEVSYRLEATMTPFSDFRCQLQVQVITCASG